VLEQLSFSSTSRLRAARQGGYGSSFGLEQWETDPKSHRGCGSVLCSPKWTVKITCEGMKFFERETESRAMDSVWLNRSTSLMPILQLFSCDLFSDLFVFSLRNSVEAVLHHTSLHGGVIC